jgi:long-subunit fatty acid transport protein
MSERNLKLDAAFANPATGTNSSLSGEYTYEATGYTPIIGFDVKPMKELTVAVRYEFETDLEFEYTQDKLTAVNSNGAVGSGILLNGATNLLNNVGFKDGAKANYNLPAMLALGAEYAVTPVLSVMTSANIYFLSQADLGKTQDSATGNVVKDTNKYFGTGYEVSLAATYLVMPELKVGAGFIWTESGAKDEYFENQYTLLNASGNPPLDSYTIGLGGTYTLANYGVDLTLAGSWTHYIPKTYKITPEGTAAGAFAGLSGEYKKDVYNIGLGVGYKM